MMTLTDFLLARIAEDEALAREALGFAGVRPEPTSGEEVWLVLHNERWSPGRLIAECEAKRRIVEWADMEPRDDQVSSFLALPYLDHPDYREEWKP